MEDKIETLLKDMFGKNTDAEIAEKIGKDRQYVANYRITHGMPVFKKWDRISPLLGIKSDREIAEIMGMRTNTITVKRRRAGISAANTGAEAKLQKEFAKTLKNPIQYVRTPYGIIDILCEDTIYELKTPLNTSSANSAVGQLLAYKNEYPNKSMAIVTDKMQINGKTRQHLDQLFIKLIIFEI